MRGLERGSGGGGGGGDEGAVVFGARAGVDEHFVGEGDGVYGLLGRGRRGEGRAGFVGVVEEERASVGVSDVPVCEGSVGGGVGGEGENFVVVLGAGSFGHGEVCTY